MRAKVIGAPEVQSFFAHAFRMDPETTGKVELAALVWQ